MQGMIHLYYGDGAGKTTAAVGLCARGAAAGLRVVFVPFLKGRPSAEWQSLKNLGAALILPELSGKFWFEMSDAEKEDAAKQMQQAFDEGCRQSESCDLLVLDEVLDAEQIGGLRPGSIEAFLQKKPAGCEVVLTGHLAFENVLKLADYVTRFTAEKHPYNQGVQARFGIEY